MATEETQGLTLNIGEPFYINGTAMVFDGENLMTQEQYQHNKHLIAAAPDMLAALKAIKESCPTDNDVTRDFNDAWGLLEAAIAKAEGTENAFRRCKSPRWVTR